MYKNCNTRDRRFLITKLLEFGNKSIKFHKIKHESENMIFRIVNETIRARRI